MITPNSKIIILKSPIELDNNNQLTFSNATNQYNYFYGLPKKILEDATFQRKDNIIRFETNETDFTYDDVLTYNYCMYQNTSFGDKWFYAFIVNCTYVNNGVVALELKTDVFQTWQFNITWKQSFVEREHIAKANDTIGANTIPENVETGEYITYSSSYLYNNDCSVIIATTFLPTSSSTGNDVSGSYAFGIYSGAKLYCMQDYASTNKFIQWCSSNGKLDSIQYIFMAPNWILRRDEWASFTDWVDINGFYDETTINTDLQLPTQLDGYTPKNKKLLTFPYSYFGISNNAGGNLVVKYEDLNIGGTTFRVKCQGTITPSCSIKCYVENNREGITNYDTGLTGAKYPICSWAGDVFTNWLTQNAVNIPLSIGGSLLSSISGVQSGNATQVTSGILGVAQTLGSIYEHSLMSDNVQGNVNSGDVAFTSDNNVMTYAYRGIKQEYARIIDNYFAMYGYATKLLKIPNTNNRSNWNYVKTINANLIGDIPQNDMQEIKQMFDNGITLWHNSSHFLDYSQSNN